MSGDDGYLVRRAGYGDPLVILITLATMQCAYDSHMWGGRTLPVAHAHLQNHFDTIPDEAVIDVEFLLGETTAPTASERRDWPLDGAAQDEAR